MSKSSSVISIIAFSSFCCVLSFIVDRERPRDTPFRFASRLDSGLGSGGGDGGVAVFSKPGPVDVSRLRFLGRPLRLGAEGVGSLLGS